jgi:hypothetical protein
MHLGPLLRKGLQFFSRHHGMAVFGFLFFVVGFSVFGGLHEAHAQAAQAVVNATTNTNNENVAVVVNLILNALTMVLNYIVIILGKVTLLLIQIIIIPILNYNSFSSSPIIGLGWSLVRDVMNMFVIVALIFVAIFTIVGNHRAHWEQQLPQLFIAVVLMNFSRTICGLLIDISQVIMFTFVNALLDIAAGNFTQLFQLQDFGKLNPVAVQASIDSGKGFDAFAQFMGAFLQVPLYGSIVAILFLLALAFLYRIVLLWILVIMSPLTFFLGGIKGIFHGAEHSAGQWWGRFTGALMMGPILTFFLWLALAAASSGSIATSEGFPTPPEGDTYFSVAALDSSHITSLLVALILLTVGMQVAGEQSSKVGGAAASLINEGMGRRVVGGALLSPYTAARAGVSALRTGAGVAGGVAGSAAGYAGQAGRYVGRELDVGLAKALQSQHGTVREAIGQNIISAGQSIGLSGIPGGARVGAYIASKGGGIEHEGEELRGSRRKAAVERIRGMSGAQQISALQMLTKGKNSGLGSPEADRALIAEYSANKKLRAEAEHLNVSQADRDNLLTMAMNTQREDQEKGRLDDKEESTFFKTQSENLHLMRKPDPTDPTKTVLDEEAVKKFVKSNDFDANKVGDKALEDPGVLKILGAEKDRSVKDKDVTYLDRFAAGKYKGRLKEPARISAQRTLSAGRTEEAFTKLRTSGADEAAYSKALKDETITLADMKVADIQGPQGRAITKAIVNSGGDINTLGAGDVDPKLVTDEFVKNVVSKQDAGTITSALSKGKVALNDIKDTDFTGATSAQRFELARGVIGADEALKEEYMGKEARDAFAATVTEMKATNNISEDDATIAHGMLLRAGKTLPEVIPGTRLDPVSPTFTKDARVYTAKLVQADAGNVKHLAPAIKDATKSNAVTRLVVANTKMAVSPEGTYRSPDVERIAAQAGKAKDDATRNDLKQRLETLAKAASVERARVTSEALPTDRKGLDERKRIEDLHDQLVTTMSLMR